MLAHPRRMTHGRDVGDAYYVQYGSVSWQGTTTLLLNVNRRGRGRALEVLCEGSRGEPGPHFGRDLWGLKKGGTARPHSGMDGERTSVGRFSNLDPVLGSVLTMRTSWHGWLWEPDGEPTFGSHMNENRFSLFLIFNFGEPDRFSRELTSGSG